MRQHYVASQLSQEIEDDGSSPRDLAAGWSSLRTRHSDDSGGGGGYEESIVTHSSTKQLGWSVGGAYRIHAITESEMKSYSADAATVVNEFLSRSGEEEEQRLVWIDLDCEKDDVEGLVAVLGATTLHPIALQALLHVDVKSGCPRVERMPYGWTVWSSTLPGKTSDRRVDFAAICSARIVITSLRVGDDDNPPVGGWWKSQRRAGDEDKAPLTPRPPARRRRRRDGEGTDSISLRTPLLNDDVLATNEEDLARRFLYNLANDGAERERSTRLGGAYVCGKLVEIAIILARQNFQEFEDTISQLTQVCTDEKPGWRNRRVRFNRTVGMLLDAGKARAHIARLRESYEQAHILARSAAAFWRRSRDNAPAALRAANEQLEPWLNHLENVTRGDLRRLHQEDNLLHAYIVVARLRHEDDYNRVNVLLSLVATIFLPLSFITGVFGMNFTKSLPLKSDRDGFLYFVALSFFITFFALVAFWYRGWLNVVKSVRIIRPAPSVPPPDRLLA